jgi:type I restriction enzyme S subunit
MREGYKDIEFIKIPETWNAYILGSENPLILKEIRNGLTISQSKENGKYKVSRIETISNETIDETRVRFIDEIDDAKLNKYLIRKGEILFSHINSDPHLGKTAIAERDYNDLLHGMNLLLFKANEKVIDPNYLNNIFRLYRQIGVFLKIRSRAVNQSSINQNKLKNLQIPLPQLPEQRKIAYVLSTVQKAIEQQDKLIRHTTELKKALMQKLFTEGTKGEKQKQTEIGLVPESWEVTTIGEMYDFTSKPRGLNINLPVPFIPMEIVPFDQIYIEEYELRENVSSGTYVENGDLLLAKITPSFENGKQGIVRIDKPYSYATTEVIPIKEKTRVSDKYFLFYYLLKDDVRKPLTDKMEGSTGRQRLSKTILEETRIPKPPIKEQKEIAKILLTFNQKLSFYQKKRQTLSDLFKTMLHELMTGQRRVHEIDFTLAVAHETSTKKYKTREKPLSMAAEK